MFSRLRGLFARYADRHLSVIGPGTTLPSADGSPLGYVENAIVHGNRVRFLGWTTADQVVLSWEGGQIVQRPHLHRPDVTTALGIEPDVGFSMWTRLFQRVFLDGRKTAPSCAKAERLASKCPQTPEPSLVDIASGPA